MSESGYSSRSVLHRPWSASHIPAQARGGRLRILATADLHGQILSYDYFSNRTLFGTGLAQLACVIAAARAEVATTLLLDNGDFLQGSALTELAAQRHRRRRANPALTAFETLGYDAVGLGNHEFNYGLDYLTSVIAASKVPMLSANVRHCSAGDGGRDGLRDGENAAPGALLSEAALLLTRMIALPDQAPQPIKIGIFALTPPETVIWDRHCLGDRLIIEDMVSTAAIWVPRLRQMGADLVICLAHSGIAHEPDGPTAEACVNALTQIAGLDAVIAGHSHQTFPGGTSNRAEVDAQTGLIHGVPVVQPGQNGSHLGLIDLWLEREGEGEVAGGGGGWRVTANRCVLIDGAEAVAGLAASQIRQAEEPLRHALRKDHRAALSWMREVLAETRQPITSYFAAVADCWITRLTGEALLAEMRRHPAVKAMPAMPLVALVSPFRIGGRAGPMNYTDIGPGEICLRHIYDLYPFPNTLVIEETTAAALLTRLERGSALLNQLQPEAKDQPLINPHLPGYSFEIAVGLDYVIDLGQPAADRAGPSTGRIAALHHQGRRLMPYEKILLISNNYLASLSNVQTPPGPAFQPHNASSRDDLLQLDTGLRAVDLLRNHIRNQGHLSAKSGPRWRLRGPIGSSALFDSGVGAKAHMHDAFALRPEPLSLTPTGFQRFRLHF